MPLKRVLSPELTLFKGRFFPYSNRKVRPLRYHTHIGIGGNVGDVPRRFDHLLMVLKRSPHIEVHRTAPLLKNPPFGFTQQDDFYNTVIMLSTSMQPARFLRYLLRLEQRFGRVRSFANAPRTLDLDILFFDNRRIETKDLCIPHPHWHERSSVVIPLAYLGESQ